jgi:transcriptional regulator with XRE-family HTH domain
LTLDGVSQVDGPVFGGLAEALCRREPSEHDPSNKEPTMTDDAADGRQPSRLLALIDDYRARNGNPPDASIARAIGVAPQTLNSWRKRGMKEMPRNPETLRNLARLLRVDEKVTAYAALVDTGYVIEHFEDEDPPAETG